MVGGDKSRDCRNPSIGFPLTASGRFFYVQNSVIRIFLITQYVLTTIPKIVLTLPQGTR